MQNKKQPSLNLTWGFGPFFMESKPPLNPNAKLEIRKLIGEGIKNIRIQRGLTQEQLSEQMGINRSTIAKIEAGKWAFSIDMITEFSHHLDFFIFLVEKDSNDELAVTMRNRWKRPAENN